MKIIFALLSFSALSAMQKETIKVPLTQELEKMVLDTSSPKRKSFRARLMNFVKAQHPEYSDENIYEIKFIATLRGSCFEVYSKEDKEVVTEIEQIKIPK